MKAGTTKIHNAPYKIKERKLSKLRSELKKCPNQLKNGIN
jgi:hypothetical protein